MAEIIRMPRMSDTMTEGVIVDWLKNVGDSVEPGDVLAEVETDKATMELENYDEGTLLYVGVAKGDAVPVNAVIAIVGEKGEDVKALLESALAADPVVEEVKEEASPAPVKVEAASPAAPAVNIPVSAPVAAPVKSNGTNGRLKASPLAKRLAKENNIDIGTVQGSGDEGRIIKRDILNRLANPVAAPAVANSQAPVVLPSVVGEEAFEDVKISQMRKAIARRLGESKYTAPHFYLTVDLDMDKAMTARKSMNEVAPVKLSFNDLVVKAAALALRHNPKVNASWQEDTIRYNKHIHVGVAVAIDDGLIVPVIKFADSKTLSHISVETKELAGRAKTKQLQPEEFSGNTFTISNLGMFGIEEFTAIINPPDSVILAVGAIRQEPVVKDGAIVVGNRMKVTLSCDHRVVDGVLGALFLKSFKSFIEDPVRLLI